jgi:hypothetical protein
MKNYFITIFLFTLMNPIINETDWSLVKKMENLEVYSRKLDSEEYKEIKIVGRIHCSMSELVLAIEDVEAQKEWVMRTIDARMIEKINVGEFYYYISTDMPFPISDRDLVVYYKRSQDPLSKVVSTVSKAKPSQIPFIDHFVRIPLFESNYTLSPEKDGWIKLEYYVKVNPGGSLPAWLVNLAAAQGPTKSMQSLYDIIASGRYQNQKVEGIIN